MGYSFVRPCALESLQFYLSIWHALIGCNIVMLMAGLYFSVSMHTGGSWCIKNGRKHYEGGSVTEFGNCHTDLFNLMELEGMLLELQWCHTNVHFWFKPKDTDLHDGYVLKSDRDLLAMFEDMRQKRYRKVDVYVDVSGKFGVADGVATSELVGYGDKNHELAVVCPQRTRFNNTPSGPKLNRCIIEELLDDADVVVDARVSAQADDYVMSNAEMRELNEELEWAARAGSGQSDEEAAEFFMHMPDMEDYGSDDRFSDADYGSDNDVFTALNESDSSIQILDDEDAIGQIFGGREDNEAHSSKVQNQSRCSEAQRSPTWTTPIPQREAHEEAQPSFQDLHQSSFQDLSQSSFQSPSKTCQTTHTTSPSTPKRPQKTRANRTKTTPSKTPQEGDPEEYREFVEEEYAPEEEELEDSPGEGPTDPSQWWGSVNDFCSQAYQDPDEDDGGYVEEEDLVSLDSDEENGAASSKKKHIEFDPQLKPDQIKLQLGMEFPTVEALRDTLKELFINTDREYKLIHNDRLRIRAVCRGPACNWLMYARRMRDSCTTFRINKLVDEHSCGIVWDNKLVDADWVSKHFLEKFRLNPTMSYGDFKKANAEGKYSKLSSWTFYRAKAKAMGKIHGSVRDQYAILHDYCIQIMHQNPGSTALMKTTLLNEKRLFERVYICLAACKAGFRYCRPLIGLDGCFLKGFCKGMMLVAIGIDANNSMLPIAYAIVEKENTETWTWFAELLKEDIDVEDPSRLTFISDRQKGLERAVDTVFQGAEVRFCVRHLYANFKKQFPGLLLKQQLWACARATTVEEFKRKMAELKATKAEAFEWLSQKAPSEWTKSHFRTYAQCDMLLNNLCESFNSAIVEGRDKPIITLLEFVRFWLMDRMRKQREGVSKWKYPVGKRVFDILQKNKKLALKCQCTKSAGGLFQVTVSSGQVEATNLETKSCSCRSYDLTGLPCGHALACIYYSQLNEYDFVADCYKIEAFVNQYAGVITPMPGPEHWPDKGKNPILPPPHHPLPGRPKKSRKREVDEPPPGASKLRRFGQSNRCSNCNEPGHAKTTCKKPIQAKVHSIVCLCLLPLYS